MGVEFKNVLIPKIGGVVVAIYTLARELHLEKAEPSILATLFPRVKETRDEQEMKAKTQQMQAVLLAAEAEVPKSNRRTTRNSPCQEIGNLRYIKIGNF